MIYQIFIFLWRGTTRKSE